MNISELCRRDVVTVHGSDDLVTAARLMRERHIGYLVVVDGRGASGRPVGVLTDRDIVIAVVARGVDPASLRVEDVMTRDPITATESTAVSAVLAVMRRLGVRRIPIVGKNGFLVGILSLDDILDGLAAGLEDAVGSMRNQQRVEREQRP
jgi:CBS domain-containing protein